MNAYWKLEIKRETAAKRNNLMNTIIAVVALLEVWAFESWLGMG